MKSLNNNQEGSKCQSFGRRNLYRLTALIAISPILFLASCSNAVTERIENVGGITAKQVLENPTAYIGKTVTVSGQVDEVRGPRAFVMDSGLTSGELLVVGREAYPQLPDADNRAYLVGDVATVTGVVRTLVTADIEREIGWDLGRELEVTYSAKPVLIAQSIAFRAGAGRANATADTNQPMANANANQPMGNTNNAAGNTRLTDVGVYGSTADKLSLVGKDAQFSNLKIVRIVGPRTFTVASGGSEIYVMLNDASARGVGTQGKLDIGTRVNLSGRFERLQAAEIDDLANNRFRALTPKERAFLKNTAVFLESSEISGLEQ